MTLMNQKGYVDRPLESQKFKNVLTFLRLSLSLCALHYLIYESDMKT